MRKFYKWGQSSMTYRAFIKTIKYKASLTPADRISSQVTLYPSTSYIQYGLQMQILQDSRDY